MDPSRFFDLLRSLAEQLPSFLTILGCIVFAIVRWKRHPRVSFWATISLTLLLLHGVVFAAVYVWIPEWFLRTESYSAVQMSRLMTILGVIYNVLLAIAFGLLLVAIFMDRKPVNRTT